MPAACWIRQLVAFVMLTVLQGFNDANKLGAGESQKQQA